MSATFRFIAPYAGVPNASIAYAGMAYVVGSTLRAAAGTTLKVTAYVKNLSMVTGTAWVGVVEGTSGGSFLGSKIQTKSISPLMTGVFSFEVKMPSSAYNACISCGLYEGGKYYEHDEECCINLMQESAPPEKPCSIGINGIRFGKGDTVTVAYYDVPQGTYLNVLGPSNSGQYWPNLYGNGTKSYTFKDTDPTGSWTVLLKGGDCDRTIRIGLDAPAAVNTKLSCISADTDVGVGEIAEFVYQLKEDKLLGKVIPYVKVRLYINDTYAFVETATDKDGKVKFVYTFTKVGDDYKVKAGFIGAWIGGINYRVSECVNTVKVTAPASAYLVTAHNLPEGKVYKVISFAGTYRDPDIKYPVTSINKKCEVLRKDFFSPSEGHTMKLFDENENFVYAAEKSRALKPTNDRLVVDLYANAGKEYRINMSHTPNTPAVGAAFEIGATLIKGQSQTMGAGQNIEFKKEVAEGLYESIGKRTTNDFGIASYQHPGEPEEGSYNFIALFEYGDASCDPHTVTVGKKPSEIEGFLEPVFKWVEESFNVDPETAKTYTYIGMGVIGLVIVGGFLK